ncbi:hypothetical protein BH10CYA1_BH10CYA1_56060 [soil metagenome]
MFFPLQNLIRKTEKLKWAQGENIYVVRFRSDAGEVEYKFTAHDQPFISVDCELSYAELTNGDPAVPLLAKAIANFHQARHFLYE